MSLRPAARAIRVWADKATSPVGLSTILANGAKQALHDAIASGDAPNAFTRYVDGKEDVPEEAVKPDGVIVYTFHYMPDVMEFAIEFLRLRSPQSSSHPHPGQKSFKNSFMIARVRTGSPIEAARINYKKLENEAFFIYNRMPYARRVDTQFVGKKRVRFRTPPGLYEDACVAIRNRYGGFVTVRRRYNITIPNQYVLRRGTKQGSPVEVPAIIIEPRP